MGIKQIETYQITEHAKQRLHERFMTTSSHITAWLLTFNKDAKQIRKQPNGNLLWQSNDVCVVTNAESKTIITVFPKSELFQLEDAVSDKQVQADLEKIALEKIKDRQVQFGAEMYVPLMNLDLLAHQLRSSDDMNNVSELYEKLMSGLNRVVERRDEANSYLMDMQKLIK